MNSIEIILLAIALGVDCCVVSFSQGLIVKEEKELNSLKLAFTMGVFQALMPAFGYLFAFLISGLVKDFSHLLVFVIFLILGINFITEAFVEDTEEKSSCIDLKCLMLLGLATSIDALGAGASLRFSENNLGIPALVIGVVSFVMSIIGFWGCTFFQKLPSKVMEICGGVILIGLAVKSLF